MTEETKQLENETKEAVNSEPVEKTLEEYKQEKINVLNYCAGIKNAIQVLNIFDENAKSFLNLVLWKEFGTLEGQLKEIENAISEKDDNN